MAGLLLRAPEVRYTLAQPVRAGKPEHENSQRRRACPELRRVRHISLNALPAKRPKESAGAPHAAVACGVPILFSRAVTTVKSCGFSHRGSVSVTLTQTLQLTLTREGLRHQSADDDRLVGLGFRAFCVRRFLRKPRTRSAPEESDQGCSAGSPSSTPNRRDSPRTRASALVPAGL